MKRKFIVCLLCLIVLFGFTGGVGAVTISTNTVSGTVDTNSKYVTNTSSLSVVGVDSQDTFKAYKILNTFYNSSANTITYEFTNEFKSFLSSTTSYKNLTVSQYMALTSGDVTNGSTTSASGLDTLVSQFASYIKSHAVNGNNLTVSGTTASGTLEVGSYLVLPVTTKRVYAVMVGNLDFKANANGTSWDLNSASIVAKVSSVSIQKKIKGVDAQEGTYSEGEDYTYVITSNVPTYPTNATNKALTITDTLASGITFNGISTVVVKDGTTTLTTKADGTVVDASLHTVATIVVSDDGKITVNFNSDYIQSNDITIEYSAKLNEDAVLGSDGNVTTTYLTYANDPYGSVTTNTGEVVTKVFTYGIRLFKHNASDEGLAGAIYTVYSDVTLNTSVGTITTGRDGYGAFDGLKSGTYYLKETKAPVGYKINNDVITVVLDEALRYTEITALDDEMGFLPSTGGIGTYVFIVLGLFIVLGSSLLLYRYLNKNKNVDKNGK